MHPERIPKENDFLLREKLFPPERKIASSRENKNPFPSSYTLLYTKESKM